ncbi:replicative DNA helicase [Thiopseudomonas alkaliphila]|uniref:Replicative DNA helicase n=1 Tax=Thiopseudomonas alkaliphila TaxID=1697053 RepID=A0AAW7DUY0_9GAMM|nr:replicative DNA helicase [Thiopseudomonas alkaliphila]MDM1696488.1 replicative DNA helicase [Thiopseudomonas alkaliphila]
MQQDTLSVPLDLEASALKTPPHSIEAEQAVLGGLMQNNNAWERVLDLVSAGDFYRYDHRLIFRAIERLAEKNSPFDMVTLADDLEVSGELEKIGGLAYLGELVTNTPSVANIRAYSEIIRERATLRELIKISGEIADSAYLPKGRAGNEILDEAERKIFQIAESRPKVGGAIGVSELLSSTLNTIDTLRQSKGGLTGLTTGFNDLNDKTSGLQKGDLIIVAGRPSMGKTTFAMNLVENALLESDKAVIVYSLEMPAESLMMRMISSLGKINQTKVRTGQLEGDEWDRLGVAVSKIQNKKLFIDDTAGISPSEMRARTRRLAREHGEIGLIMIDYLQLMQIAGSSGDNRTNEISEISRSLKALAKEFDCPVVALSQLNRALEQRPNKRPVNSDLRESGAIEQDADVIMFVYRDEVYHPETEHKGVAEIIIGKQRNGPIGTVRLAFLGQYTRFESLANHYPDYD